MARSRTVAAVVSAGTSIWLWLMRWTCEDDCRYTCMQGINCIMLAFHILQRTTSHCSECGINTQTLFYYRFVVSCTANHADRVLVGSSIVKYYGKWPFIRVAGMQVGPGKSDMMLLGEVITLLVSLRVTGLFNCRRSHRVCSLY